MKWNFFIKLTLWAVACIGLTQCATTTAVSLDYQPTANAKVGPRTVAMARVIDRRGLGPYYLGTLRTPVGTPIEQLQTRVPVEDVVRNSMSHGLNVRRMLTSQANAEYIMTGEVLEFTADQLVRSGAFARIRVNLVRASSGELLYSRVYESQRYGGASFNAQDGTGWLREHASRALQDVVDQALDDPNMRPHIRPSAPPLTPAADIL